MKTERSPADAERKHQEAFGRNCVLSQGLVELVDRVRDNDPTLTELDLRRYTVSQLSDLAWELLGRYIEANTHLEDVLETTRRYRKM